MFGGNLKRVKFQYLGVSSESNLDWLSIAKIIAEEDGEYTISAKVFGDGNGTATKPPIMYIIL